MFLHEKTTLDQLNSNFKYRGIILLNLRPEKDFNGFFEAVT